MNNIPKYKVYLPIFIAIAFGAGMWVSIALFRGETKVFGFAVPPKNKINTVIDYVNSEYVDEVNTDELIEKAIPQFLKELDPHSIYITAEEALEVNEPLEGNFEGVGIQFNIRNDTIVVVNTISGGPSEKLGLRAGDRIIMINDSLVAGVGVKNSQVVKKLKGPRGTKVKVSVHRKGRDELLNFTIVRDKIPLNSVDVTYMIDEKTAYIKISSFSRTTYREFINAVYELNDAGMKKMILDLRSNSGGYLEAATNITDEFFAGGEVIVYTEGKARPRKTIYATDKRLTCVDIELAVLIDEFSASASEIVAGAIQDNDRGWIVGRRSFGKGLVQEPTVFGDGSVLRLTTARYYTPSGRCIQKSYSEGYDDYYDDIFNRYLNGEFQEADSIHFADSLKFYTIGNRIVYGGGGIMPDIFVPVDTSIYSDLFNAVVDYGFAYSFAFNYTDKNREALNELKTIQQIEDYLDQALVMDAFYSYLREKKLHFTYSEYMVNYNILRLQLYAYIGRNIINDNGFYPFINRMDNTIERVLDLLNSKESLN